MDYRYLGHTGLRISEISLGTQTFGWTTSERDAHAMLDFFSERGGNYLDTADSYNEGESERILGSWLGARHNHDNLIIGTKVFFDSRAGGDSNRTGSSRKHIHASLDRSLSRLGVEAIDLYQLHCFDAGTAQEEVLETMEDLVRRGKILHFGLSNFTPSSIARLATTARFRGFRRPAALQLEYSLLVRSPEWELLPVCREEELGTLAWSPLAGGWLSGKYRKDARPPEDSRAGRKDRWDDQEEQRGGERTWAILSVVEKIAAARNVPCSQVSLNWLRRKPLLSSILTGARNMDQLAQNLDCVSWNLSPEEEGELDTASDIGRPYPYAFIHRYGREDYRG
jgi:aryl-alcohol dehydrogenase-like predicted oxidoreductase